MGQFDSAEQVLEESLHDLEAASPEEVPRACCNLGNLWLRRRDPDTAHQWFSRGLALNLAVTYGFGSNAAFLNFGLSRVHLGLGNWSAAVLAALDGLAHTGGSELYPRRLLLTAQGLAEVCQGSFESGMARLLSAAEAPRSHATTQLRFGLSTGFGHAVMATLRYRPQTDPPELLALVSGLTSSARLVIGLNDGARFAEEVEHLLRSGRSSAEQLIDQVERLVNLFPYGIDPWLWRRHVSRTCPP